MDDVKLTTATLESTTEQEVAPKRKRRTKAEIEAAKVEAEAAEAKKVKAAEAKAKREAKKAAEAEAAVEAAVEVEDVKTIHSEPVAKVAAEPITTEVVKVEKSVEIDDIAGKSDEQLCEILATDIQNMPPQQLRARVELIKIAFYKLVRAVDDARRLKFISDGGNADEYTVETTDIEKRFKALLTLYRERRDSVLAASEEQKQVNYKAKEAIIEELKALINSTETMGQTFAAFHDLQNRWKQIGIVPLAQTKDLWETYHHHTENFYNFIKINKELRDIDLKRNYETKIALCEQAEALLENPSATAASTALQKLHDQYREAGPVALEFKEQLWERFKAASARVNKRHQEYYDSMRQEQESNLALKSELCSKVEQFASLPLTSIREWNSVQEQIAELQKVWKTIGFAPKKDNNRIYERFRTACDKFFAAKRAFFSGMRTEMDDNMQVKTDLCVQAEALSDSEDWKTTTDAIIDLQKRWKEAGAVSRKYSDAIWKRFRAACDKFFERKSSHFKSTDGEYADNLAAKQAILVELEAMATSDALSFDSLKEVMQRWSAIGFVPFKQKQQIATKYKEVVDNLFNILRKGEGASRVERYKERVSAMRGGDNRGGGRTNTEHDKLFARMRSLEADITLLENNIGFFGKSKNAAALVADVERKIEKARAELAEIVAKIKILEA